MAVLDFLDAHKIRPIVLHCYHGTNHADQAAEFVQLQCKERGLQFRQAEIGNWREKYAVESWEEYWRNFRLDAFAKESGGLPVLTAHNLDDVCETWIWSSLHGKSKLLPYSIGNVIRPFRATPKSELLTWCERKKVLYLNDPSNSDLKFVRNRIRHNLMPEALVVNPGLRTVLLKKVLSDAQENPP